MRRAYLSQLVKLRRRVLLLGTFGASAAFALLATAITIGTAAQDDPDTPRAPGGPELVSLDALAEADGAVLGLEGATQLLGVVALVLAASVVGSEWTQGTLRGLLVRQPRRLALLGGSWLAIALVVAAAAVVAGAVAVLAAFALAPVQGVDTGAWTTGEGVGAIARATGGTVLATVGFATFGAVLGVLLRSPVAAIGVGIAWLLPVEAILGGVSDAVEAWLPGQLLEAVVTWGTDAVSGEQALAVVAAQLAVAAMIAAWSFRTRDVTA
jgi:hypothetical protein